MTGLRGDHGQSAIEIVVVLPCVIALISTIVAGARLIGARSAVEAVAREAAVAAAQSSTSTAAATAEQAGDQAATNYGMDPTRLRLNLEGAFARGGTITVVCRYTVSLAPFPGSVTVEVSQDEPVDPFRSF